MTTHGAGKMWKLDENGAPAGEPIEISCVTVSREPGRPRIVEVTVIGNGSPCLSVDGVPTAWYEQWLRNRPRSTRSVE